MDAYQSLITHWRETSLLSSCAALLGWDERTYMPRAGSAHRAKQMALLARMTHERLTDPRIGDWLSQLEGATDSAEQAANVREIGRTHRRAVRVPARLVEELARVTTQAQEVWVEARAAADFRRFLPWLDRIVALKREEAEALGNTAHPYDALLEEYEPGSSSDAIERLFRALARELAPFAAKLFDAPRQPNESILRREFPVADQERFGRAVAEAMGFDFQAGRLDVTTHPFCSGIGPGDCRLTTRYDPNHFSSGFFGILHECGHGIYEQNLPREHFGTPLGTACSLGIHESQSRLWENFVGRSPEFWQHYFPKAQDAFPSLRDVRLEDFVLAVNRVGRTFIRVEADEVTYNLHIVLRFELEKNLIQGDLSPGDVPDAWNQRFHELLGVRPPNDREGCLQDIHWSFGGIGYFPTYALGNLYAAQFMEAARRDLGEAELAEDFRQGRFNRLREWLVSRIHRQGQLYRAEELCRQVTGADLNHQPFMRYLRGKYSRLYGVLPD
ncbi:MAG: carboxypeptidase M32 [Gemmataceae bacterium]|nr:carboxypeptidase M32 [Gemmataceae bacterium]